MDKHLGVFITLMNGHLHVSLNCAFNMITYHVDPPRAWAIGDVQVFCICGVQRMAEGYPKLRKN